MLTKKLLKINHSVNTDRHFNVIEENFYKK